jgi:uncharacterized membrane protein
MWVLSLGFIKETLAAAVKLLGLEMCFYLNKNCLFKLEF